MNNRNCAIESINKIQLDIAQAVADAKRPPGCVTLIGAAKQQSVQSLSDVIDAGLDDIGENYVDEGVSKQIALNNKSVNWHFIGKLQSNKTKLVAQHFSWVHGVDRFKIAERLNNHNKGSKVLKILLQLNLDDEASKGGVNREQAFDLVDQIQSLESLKLKGFMLIPKARDSVDEQRRVFAQARELLEQVNQRHNLNMDSLSMGMSNDYKSAIAEGSTMVRIGTRLFGPRRK